MEYFPLCKEIEENRNYLKHNMKIYESSKNNIQKKSNQKTHEKGLDYAFAQVRKFQRMMDQPVADKPQPLDKERALFRMILTNEELVEFLYATVKGDFDQFDELVDRLKIATDNARDKIKKKGEKVDNILVSQVDASTDAKFLMLGTDTELGVYPQEMQNIVHAANLAKLFPDGKAHFNEIGKVIKPDNWERDFAPEDKIAKAIDGQIRRAEQRNKSVVRGGQGNHIIQVINK